MERESWLVSLMHWYVQIGLLRSSLHAEASQHSWHRAGQVGVLLQATKNSLDGSEGV